MNNYRPIILLVFVLSISLACSVLQPSTSPAPRAVETQVAATFTFTAPNEVPATESATQVTTIPSEEPTLAPQVTPETDGLIIVYAKDNVIYLWQAGAAPKALTASGSPIYALDLSDDGQVIAFTRQTGDVQAEFWAVNIDGSDERVLVSEDDFKSFDPEALAVVPYHFSWRPGTHLLAFNTNQVFEGPRPGLYDDLRLVDVDTMTQSTLLEPGQGGEFYYSPDGSQIAITIPTSISLINADGSNLRPNLVQYEAVLTYSEYQYYAKPRWLPDSSGLRVMIPPVDSLADPRPPTSLWEIPIDGSPASKIGEIVMTPFFTNNAAYSPNMMKIAYMIETGEPAQNIHELHFTNPDGSGDQYYHAESLLNFMGWSKDSLHFAITAGEDRIMHVGQLDTPYSPAGDAPNAIIRVRWIDNERYLYLKDSGNGATIFLAGLTSTPIAIDQLPDANAPIDFFD